MPDIAVLIAAPDASLTHQHRRVQRALLAGVREVLSIDPFVRVGVRFDAAGAPTPHVRGQLPSLVCPGLTIDLDALWQCLDDPRRRWSAPTPAIIPSESSLPYAVHTGAASSSIPQLTPEHTVPVTLTPQPMTGAMLADLPPRAHYGWSGERLLVEDWATTRRLMRRLLRAHGLHQTVALLPRERWLLALGRREPSQRDRKATRHAWWLLARQAALLLRGGLGVAQIGVAGDLVHPVPLDYWSMITLVVDRPLDAADVARLLSPLWGPVPMRVVTEAPRELSPPTVAV